MDPAPVTAAPPAHERGDLREVRGRIYHSGRVRHEDPSPAEVVDGLCDENVFAWLDLVAPPPSALRELARQLGLHPLAVEDALAEPQRPKLDRYPGHLFIAAYRPSYDADTCGVNLAELSIFVTERVLVTVRQRADALEPAELIRRWDEHATLSGHGVDFLLHGLLDYVVDDQYAVTRRIEEAVEDLEDSLFDDPGGGGTDVQRRGFVLRKTLTRTRRIATPTRDLLLDLDRPDVGVIDGTLAPYFADVRDHAVRSVERLDSLREMVASVLDTRLALRGDQLNEIMKKLTSWAAIIAVPTAVTGFYGQNVPYPGFQEWSGFIASASLTVLIALVLYVVFRRRSWL
jgi:magnesium transporter